MATRLAQGLMALGCAALLHPVEANEIFVRLPEPVLAGLEQDGFAFHRRPHPNRQIIRLVTSWNTPQEAIDSFLARARLHAGND
jgi:threonine aldolase